MFDKLWAWVMSVIAYVASLFGLTLVHASQPVEAAPVTSDTSDASDAQESAEPAPSE